MTQPPNDPAPAWRRATRVIGHALGILAIAGLAGAVQSIAEPNLIAKMNYVNVTDGTQTPAETDDTETQPDPIPEQSPESQTNTTAPTPTQPQAQESPTPLQPPVVTEAQPTTPAGISTISLNIAKELFETGLGQFIDARTPEAFAQGYIAGAINAPPGDIIDRPELADQILEFFDPASPTIIYCTGGACTDSAATAGQLQQLGFTNLRILKESYDQWRDATGYVVIPNQKTTGEAP